MFCVNCGSKLLEGSVFCANCGSKILTDNNIEHHQSFNKTSKRKTKKPLILFIVVVLIVGGSTSLVSKLFVAKDNNTTGALSAMKTDSEFTDEMLIQVVEEIVGKSYEKITKKDLLNIEEITAVNNGIKSIEGIDQLKNLRILNLQDNEIRSIEPLSRLENLYNINLANNDISDIAPLSNIDYLLNLTLSGNEISDLNPLRGMTIEGALHIINNKISDLTPLKDMELGGGSYFIGNPIDVGGFRDIAELYFELVNYNQFTMEGDRLPEEVEKKMSIYLKKENLLGTWIGVDDYGDTALYEFNPDNTFTFVVYPDNVYVEGYYVLDIQEGQYQPITVMDLYSGNQIVTDEIIWYETGIGIKDDEGEEQRFNRSNDDEFYSYLKNSRCIHPISQVYSYPVFNDGQKTKEEEEAQDALLEDLISYQSSNTAWVQPEDNAVVDSKEVKNKEKYLKYIGSDISIIKEEFGEPLSTSYLYGGLVYEYEDIVFTFNGIDEVGVNVYGLFLFKDDEIFKINVGMNNGEISEILGQPAFSGYSEIDGNFFYSIYYIDNYKLMFYADYEDEDTYFLTVSIYNEEVVRDDEYMLKTLEQAVDYFVESYDINLSEQDVSQNNEVVIDGVKYYSVTVVSLSGRGAAVTYYIYSEDGTIQSELDAPEWLMREFWS